MGFYPGSIGNKELNRPQGALFVKSRPLEPPQKLLIYKNGHGRRGFARRMSIVIFHSIPEIPIIPLELYQKPTQVDYPAGPGNRLFTKLCSFPYFFLNL